MRKFLFLLSILVICFGSLAYLANVGKGREGILKPLATHLMNK